MGQVRYTITHEWLEIDGETGTMGVTDRLSLEFGDIIYVEMPEIGGEYEQEEPMGQIEFANGDTLIFHAPLSGEVTKVNEALDEDPDLLNSSPEGDGWICQMRLEDPREFFILMERSEYETYDDDEVGDFEVYDGDDLSYAL